MEGLPLGTRFPAFAIDTLNDGRLRLPDDLAGRPAVLVFYRGHF
jgi:hypothetical protein